MIDQFRDWLRSDEKAKTKLIFILVVTILIVSFLTLIVYLNVNSLNQNDVNNQQTSSSISQSEEVVDEVTDSFESDLSAKRIESVSDSAINSLMAPIFNEDGEIIYTNNIGKVYKGQELLSDNVRSFPVSSYIYENNLILNEGDNVSVIDLTSNESTRMPSKFFNAVPVGDFIYTLEKTEENQFTVNRYSSIPKTGNESSIFIGSGELNGQSQYFELRRFESSFVIFDWNFGFQKGDVDLYQVRENKFVPLNTFENIDNFKILNDIVLIRFDGKRDINSYDFSGSSNIQDALNNSFFIDLAFLTSSAGYNFDILPRRCDQKNNQEIYCLVKSPLNASNDDTFIPDTVLKINTDSGNVDTVYSNLVFSASTLYWNEVENTHYFVSALDNKLYKFAPEI